MAEVVERLVIEEYELNKNMGGPLSGRAQNQLKRRTKIKNKEVLNEKGNDEIYTLLRLGFQTRKVNKLDEMCSL